MDAIDPTPALRPFVPARDFEPSKRFCGAVGFVPTHADDEIAILKLGSFGFILPNVDVREFAENRMVQLPRPRRRRVAAPARDRVAGGRVRRQAAGGARDAEPGLKVGFLFDPSRALWHVAEAPF